MKTSGIIRRMDNLGRVVIPIHLRKKANIYENDDVEITLNERNQIVIGKYNSLVGMTRMFDSIVSSLYSILQGTAIITDQDQILSSYGVKSYSYKKATPLSSEMKKRIRREAHSLPAGRIIDGLNEESTTYVQPIMGRNGNLSGSIVYIYEKDLLENVSKILASYAIFISEMMKQE